MKQFWLVWVLVSVCVATQAQTPTTDYDNKYKIAQNLLKQKDYERAVGAFNELIQPKYKNDLVAFAHYFNALALFKSNRYFQAKAILRTLTERFPEWKRQDEASYLLANIYFAEADYSEAIATTNEIVEPSIKADVEAMKSYYFGSITDINSLKKLYEKHPEERLLALTLSDLIQRTSTDPRDLALSDKIANRYGVKRSTNTPQPSDSEPQISKVTTPYTPIVKKKERPSKGFLNMGILMPFNVETLDPDKKASNQYVLDMYQGMKLARTKLQSEAVIANIYAFDVGNNTDGMLELVNNKNFEQMDLVIGPVYAETNRIASQFCHENGILLVNPLTTSPDVTVNQPLSYSAVASMPTMAKKAATFAKDKFQNRQMAIFYGASRNDSLMAQYYRQALEQEGFSTFVCQKFSPEINIDLVGRKVGHVFLANYDRKLGQALITYLDRKKVTSPLVALADAFNTEIFSAGMFNGRDYYFIDPDFVEKGKTDTEAFQKNYFNKYNALPSNYAFLGYDMMLFWGRILQKYGYNKVQTGLSIKKYDEGFTTQGFDYRDHNDNQSVPILHYDNYKLVVVAK